MNWKLLIVTGLFLPLVGSAQPDSLWSRTYGGETNEECYSIIQLPDSGYVLAGYADNGWNYDDFWVVRTNADGDSLRSRHHGGEFNERCYSIIPTGENGFALGGYTQSFGAGGENFWLLLLNSNLSALGHQAYGAGGRDVCYSILQLEDGSLVMGGVLSRYWLPDAHFGIVKTNNQGDSLWIRTYDRETNDVCKTLIQCEDGGFILGGYSGVYGESCDIWLVKTNANGDSLWSRTFGGDSSEVCNSVIQTMDGGYALAGYTRSFGADKQDFYLVRTDENGELQWTRTYGGEEDDCCNSIILARDGGFILAGTTRSFGSGREDFWIVRTDVNGDSLWSCTYGGDGRDECHSVIQTVDGGFALAGFTHSFSYHGVGVVDFWLVKTGTDPVSVSDYGNHSSPQQFIFYPAYPNPFNSTAIAKYWVPYSSYISIKVFDLLGRHITTRFEGYQQTGLHSVRLNSNSLPSGIYLIRMDVSEQCMMSKIHLLR